MQVRAVTCDVNCRSYAFARVRANAPSMVFSKGLRSCLYGVRLIHSDNKELEDEEDFWKHEFEVKKNHVQSLKDRVKVRISLCRDLEEAG
jgi:hypothetical protein